MDILNLMIAGDTLTGCLILLGAYMLTSLVIQIMTYIILWNILAHSRLVEDDRDMTKKSD